MVLHPASLLFPQTQKSALQGANMGPPLNRGSYRRLHSNTPYGSHGKSPGNPFSCAPPQIPGGILKKQRGKPKPHISSGKINDHSDSCTIFELEWARTTLFFMPILVNKKEQAAPNCMTIPNQQCC